MAGEQSKRPVTVSREELYARVWDKPMNRLAAEGPAAFDGWTRRRRTRRKSPDRGGEEPSVGARKTRSRGQKSRMWSAAGRASFARTHTPRKAWIVM
jgi:hypothetical protein